MTAHVAKQGNIAHETSTSQEDRLDTAAWGLIVIMAGAIALPAGPLANILAAATGAALLGVNIVRAMAGLAVSWFSAVLGGVVLVAAVAAMAGTHIDVIAAFLIAMGVAVVASALVDRG